MNDEVIQDLKQFITASLSQALSEQNQELDKKFDKIDQRFERLETKVDRLETKIDDVDAKSDAILEAVGEHIEDHETRIKKLEAHTV